MHFSTKLRFVFYQNVLQKRKDISCALEIYVRLCGLFLTDCRYFHMSGTTYASCQGYYSFQTDTCGGRPLYKRTDGSRYLHYSSKWYCTGAPCGGAFASSEPKKRVTGQFTSTSSIQCISCTYLLSISTCQHLKL